MTLIVQDDTGQVAGANGYITVAFFRSYHGDRGVDLSGVVDADIETAIIRGTDYMDTRWRYKGIRSQTAQETEWPRYNIIDVDNLYVYGIVIHVQRACAEYSLIALNAALNPTPTRDATGQRVIAKTTQVGPILNNVRYAPGAIFTEPTYPIADGLLKRRGYIISSTELTRG